MDKLKVGNLVGSIAKASINRKLAYALAKLAPAELKLEEIAIAGLPMYSYDHDKDYPQVARRFKQAIADADGLLFVTPEYNRSIPGVLKNAIDWGSRPWGDNSFTGKPTGVIGTSPGSIGTAVAQQHLRGILNYCNAPLMNDVEAYVQFKPDMIDADGNVANDDTAGFLRKYMRAYAEFLPRMKGTLPKGR